MTESWLLLIYILMSSLSGRVRLVVCPTGCRILARLSVIYVFNHYAFSKLMKEYHLKTNFVSLKIEIRFVIRFCCRDEADDDDVDDETWTLIEGPQTSAISGNSKIVLLKTMTQQRDNIRIF